MFEVVALETAGVAQPLLATKHKLRRQLTKARAVALFVR
jgi:hypothetical protein